MLPGPATEKWLRARGHVPPPQSVWLQALSAQLEQLDHPTELVSLTQELADWVPSPHRQGLQLLLIILFIDLREGATLTPINNPLSQRLHRLTPDHPDAAQALASALNIVQSPEIAAPIISTSNEPAPVIATSKAFQLYRMAQLEQKLGSQLLKLVNAPHRASTPPPEAIHVGQHPLSDEQQQAVLAAAQSGLTVITGGPGTGKTSIIFALIQLFQEQGLALEEIVLSAPTGKATRRLAEAVQQLGPEHHQLRIQTLHRLLGAVPGRNRFLYNEERPLPARVVIVDEASMLDLDLASRMVEALDKTQTQLVLLGDAEQIPSVDPGSVLLDLTAGLPQDTVYHLRQSFRMNPNNPSGRQVLLAAQAVQTGHEANFFKIAQLTQSVSETPPVQFLELPSNVLRQAFLRTYLKLSPLSQPAYQKNAQTIFPLHNGQFSPHFSPKLEALFSQVLHTQLLTITRHPGFQAGSESTNQRIHALYANLTRQDESTPFLPGEPVMMLHNDYKRRIYNGDVGIVVQVIDKAKSSYPTLMVVFSSPEGWLAFDLEAIKNHLSLSHAMTVHKSQGSEYERIFLLLPESDVPLLTREILYTAITRARTGVVIAGQSHLFSCGLNRRCQRHSGLGKYL